MSKAKFIKRIVSIFLILNLIYANLNMAIFGLISYAKSDEQITCEVGKIIPIAKLLSNTQLYCMNHGLDFAAGNYYCYEAGNLNDIDLALDIANPGAVLAYLVDSQTNTQRSQYYDPIANAVWALVGSNPEPGVDYLTILQEAIEQTSIKEKGNINIVGPTGVIQANNDGEYGPFKVTYPTDSNGKLIGDSFQILVNGKPLTTIPQSGEDFYLTVNDGIISGKENKIEIVYQGTIYSGTYGKFTPERILTRYLKCEKCGKEYKEQALGYIAYGYSNISSSEIWKLIGEHSNCSGKLVEISNGVEYVNNLQDLIYVIPHTRVIKEEIPYIFSVIDDTIELSGKVWLDGQTGIKNVQAPNGKMDKGENGLAGVVVNLKRTDGKDSKVEPVVTDSNGNYKFENVPANQNYYIEFVYDGINYITTVAGDSDATEENRTAFNNKFQTITTNKAVGTDGTTTALKYNYNNGAAELETMSGGKVKTEFEMKAITAPTTYTKDTSNIDLGLVEKKVDLAAVTDIYSATVKINGKVSQAYTYNDLQLLKKDSEGNPILTDVEKPANYNLFLYESDYNYRILDYDLPNAVQENDLTVAQNEQYGIELSTKRKNDGELSVDIAYQILLNNQSATDATINQIAYYFDARFDLKQAIDLIETSSDAQFAGRVVIDGKTYNKVIFNVNKTFDGSINQRIGQVVLSMSGDKISINEPIKNWVEITSYSTNNSCVDKDSAPDNFTTNIEEDDTDDAGGINVQINSIQREVKGYVFEDKKDITTKYHTGNGKYDSVENKVDDVIVQLIEIKKVTIGDTTLELEYIWQETVSGSDTVYYVTKDGTGRGQYNVTKEPGQYTFNKYIIPGDYIVRFIYGDGTYYDADSAGNITKYNGQDYKSTIDIGYNKTNYSKSLYGENSSARDNEARRLEVMDYALNVTKPSDLLINQGTEAEIKQKLENTWMCAETSLVEMNVSDAKQGDTENAISRAVNFGLIEKPKSNLLLEKHITEVKLQDTVTATASFDDYKAAMENGFKVETSSKDVFATATSKKDNSRGGWIIDTDFTELAGKRLDITYSYRIKNIGDPDYTTSTLRNAGKSYKEIAENIKKNTDENYEIGKYLGNIYYAGVEGNNKLDAISAISVQIEDYLSIEDGLELNSSSNFTEIGNAEKHIWKYKETSSSDKETEVGEEVVRVLQSEKIQLNSDGEGYTSLSVFVPALNTTSTYEEDFTYRSYAAQLIYPTEGNLAKVQSYVAESAVPLQELVPEDDEAIAETVVITKNTGGDKITAIILTISITAGLAVVAAGIILIKKYVIK